MQEGLARAYDHSTWLCNDGDPYTASGYRLPTDAEWEFAAQYDDERIYPWGNESPDCNRAYYWDCVEEFGPRFTEVGGYPAAPAELGLYDIAGNVAEFCNDWARRYSVCNLGTNSETNPVGPDSGEQRVLRSGLRCAHRSALMPRLTTPHRRVSDRPQSLMFLVLV